MLSTCDQNYYLLQCHCLAAGVQAPGAGPQGGLRGAEGKMASRGGTALPGGEG